jgi:hypothetical protein
VNNPLQTQIGGTHYMTMKIQPIEFICANELGFIEGCVVKYICRWRNKDGIKDLRKIQHYVELLIRLHQADAATQAEAVTPDTMSC